MARLQSHVGQLPRQPLGCLSWDTTWLQHAAAYSTFKAPSNVDFQPEMKWTQLSLNLTWHFTIHDYHQTFRFLASTVPGQSSHKPFEMAPSLQFVLPSTFVTSCSWSTRWVRADSAPPRPPSWGPKRQRRRGRGAIGAAPGRGATWRGWFERIFWISVLGDLTISIFLED